MKNLKITVREDILLLEVRVQPRASRNAIAGCHNGALKVRLTAPPVEDRANRELIKFLAKSLNLPERHLSLFGGHRSRAKTVSIRGISREMLKSRLAQYLV